MHTNWIVDRDCPEHDLTGGWRLEIHSGGVRANGGAWGVGTIVHPDPSVTIATVTHVGTSTGMYDLREAGSRPNRTLTGTVRSGGGSWTATEG
jgi:hypothetical protein